MADASKNRRVVIAMDGSDHANYAFGYFVENIHRPSDEVILIYCADISIVVQSQRLQYWGFTSFSSKPQRVRCRCPKYALRADKGKIEKMISDQQKSMEDITEDLNLKIQKSGINGRITRVMDNDIGHAIVKQAEKEGASLIVTGTRGRSKLRRTFLGGVSEYIVNHASMPVLTCRYVPQK
ncbi:hypothetical protein LOTGIDRAFT_234396 [Lottia gigantea]|uniref:UspA domain-containing protein n=1 Tax=Lottia gigantea TaxID=225164 RepID=V3ZCK6_LOTGI|nr:hypothetical protein LOTGIDRAFT_234396 [Lottia gigantea]ESO88808.1 hypothetical protein LOTGIDRAFT_234396 [Lottia gigantea]